MAAMTLPPHDDTPPRAGGAQRPGSRLIRELLWRRIDVAGIEYFRLWESAAGPRLTGTVILADSGMPLRLKYAVACAPDWTSRGVHVALTRGTVTRHVKITAGDGQRWWRSAEETPRPGASPHRKVAEDDDAGAAAGSDAAAGPRPAAALVEIPSVAGCLDVDLAFTPATNILPLRRLDLAVGESREVTAAWLLFPDLTVEPLPQRYTRLDERRVRYESRGGAFTAELEVDELGLVMRYPPLWERVAVG
jgi:uncharacterized protein